VNEWKGLHNRELNQKCGVGGTLKFGNSATHISLLFVTALGLLYRTYALHLALCFMMMLTPNIFYKSSNKPCRKEKRAYCFVATCIYFKKVQLARIALCECRQDKHHVWRLKMRVSVCIVCQLSHTGLFPI
jgi:hypothetical protein